MVARLFLSTLALLGAACTTPSIVATRSIQYGDIMNNANRYDEAIAHYKEFLRVSPQLGIYRNQSQEADVSRKLAHAYSTQGKFREALAQLQVALAIDSTISTNRIELIEDYRQLGIVNAYMGAYPEAMRYLKKSMILNEGMDQSRKDIKVNSLADTYLSVAQVNLTLGNFREAGTYARKARALYEKTASAEAGLVECLLLLGIIDRDLGNLQPAAEALKASADMARRHQMNRARQHQALGELYFLSGEPEEGLRQKSLAIDEAERSRIKPQIVMMYMRMGDAFQKLGDPVRSAFFYQKAISVKTQMDADTIALSSSGLMRFSEAQKAYDYYSRSGVNIGIALVSLRLGELLVQKAELDSALIMFNRAMEIFTSIGSREGMARAEMEISNVLEKKQSYDAASGHLEKALSLTLQPDLAWQVNLRTGILQERRGHYQAAHSSYLKAISIIDEMRAGISIEEFKTLFANSKVEVYDRLIGLLLSGNIAGLDRRDAEREAFRYNEQSRSRTFLDMLGNKKIDAKEIADTALLEKEQLLRLKIQQLSRQINVSGDAATERQLTASLKEAQAEFDDIVARIKLHNPAYATIMPVDPPALEDIQAILDPATAVVEYWIRRDELVVWVMTQKSLSATTVPVSAGEIHRLVRGCRNGIAYRDAAVMRNSLTSLYTTLITPLKSRLAGIENLVIVPHKSLHFLPFQALQSANGTFLVQEYVVTYVPSSSIYFYCQQRETSHGDTFLGMALADLSIGRHATLPGTRSEVKVLSQLYPASVIRSGTECGETYLKENIRRFDYVHIATHGLWNEQDPVHSYLLMAPSAEDDGKLTVHEIFALDMRSRFVTLSACETALGDLSEGDELVGLSRAFIYAGAGAVMVSLWKVDDQPTALLMTRFHQYITSGHTASQALSMAQRDLIRKKTNPGLPASPELQELAASINTKTIDNPFYWAPFILVGNGEVR